MPPLGHFRWLSPAERPVDDQGRNHFAFAAGSGITPVLSILKSDSSPNDRKTPSRCVTATAVQGSVMFLEELHDLKDEALDPAADLPYLQSGKKRTSTFSRVASTATRCERWSNTVTSDPTPSTRCTSAAPARWHPACPKTPSRRVGFPPTAFATSDLPPPRAAPTPGPQRPPLSLRARPRTGNGSPRDRRRSRTHFPHGCERRRSSLPRSVRASTCPTPVRAACAARADAAFVEGDVQMDVCYSLEPWELEAGFVLACQAHPTTDKVVLDFDAH